MRRSIHNLANEGRPSHQQVQMFSISRVNGTGFFLAAFIATSCPAELVAAQAANIDAIHLSDDIVPAPDGFEAAKGKYVTAKPTDVYISPFIWAGKVIGLHLNAGQPVEVLAKLKGYDWLLIGRGGEGIGYVPISALSSVK
jgi:hypothetical protein